MQESGFEILAGYFGSNEVYKAAEVIMLRDTSYVRVAVIMLCVGPDVEAGFVEVFKRRHHLRLHAFLALAVEELRAEDIEQTIGDSNGLAQQSD